MLAPMDSPSPGRARIVAGFLAIYLLWGGTYLAIRFAIETMPPFLMASLRWIVAGTILVAWARLHDRAPSPTRAQLRSTAIIGLLLIVGGNGIVSWAEQWVASGVAALLVGSIPLWMAFLDWAVARVRGVPHRLAPRSALGLLIGFAGVATLAGAPPSGGRAEAIGVAMLLLAALLWAVGSLFARGADLPRSPLLGTGLEMLWGSAGLLVLGTISGEWSRLDLAHVSGRSAASFSLSHLLRIDPGIHRVRMAPARLDAREGLDVRVRESRGRRIPGLVLGRRAGHAATPRGSGDHRRIGVHDHVDAELSLSHSRTRRFAP